MKCKLSGKCQVIVSESGFGSDANGNNVILRQAHCVQDKWWLGNQQTTDEQMISEAMKAWKCEEGNTTTNWKQKLFDDCIGLLKEKLCVLGKGK